MTESEKARAWRESHGLSVDELAEKSGYSRETIYMFERGSNNIPARRTRLKARKGEISDATWHRYRMACAGVDGEIGAKKKFRW